MDYYYISVKSSLIDFNYLQKIMILFCEYFLKF